MLNLHKQEDNSELSSLLHTHYTSQQRFPLNERCVEDVIQGRRLLYLLQNHADKVDYNVNGSEFADNISTNSDLHITGDVTPVPSRCHTPPNKVMAVLLEQQHHPTGSAPAIIQVV